MLVYHCNTLRFINNIEKLNGNNIQSYKIVCVCVLSIYIFLRNAIEMDFNA